MINHGAAVNSGYVLEASEAILSKTGPGGNFTYADLDCLRISGYLNRPMFGFKSFRAALSVLAGIELMHMTRKGRFMLTSCYDISFADRFYALAPQVRSAQEPGKAASTQLFP